MPVAPALADAAATHTREAGDGHESRDAPLPAVSDLP